MIKILWVAQRGPLPIETQVLEEIYGKVQIIRLLETYYKAEDIKRISKEGKYDEIVVVEDNKCFISQLVDMGIAPLWPEMVQIKERGEAHLETNKRLYRFGGFKRIKEVKYVFA